jgi:hypothetical protein
MRKALVFVLALALALFATPALADHRFSTVSSEPVPFVAGPVTVPSGGIGLSYAVVHHCILAETLCSEIAPLITYASYKGIGYRAEPGVTAGLSFFGYSFGVGVLRRVDARHNFQVKSYAPIFSVGKRL